jgi:hypothetical protein
MIVCPVPFWDTYVKVSAKDKGHCYYLLSDLILCFMLCRFFFFVRTCVNYTVYTDAYSKKLCKTYGFDAGVRFTFKCMILEHPATTFFSFFVLSVFLQVYTLRIFEMPYFRTLDSSDSNFQAMDSLFNSLWCVVITMTTVGYGDIAPTTTPGRCVAMIVALYGAFLISLLVATMSSFIELNQNQKMALRHIGLTRKAAIVISSSLKYFRAKKRFYLIQKELDKKKYEKSAFVKKLLKEAGNNIELKKQYKICTHKPTIKSKFIYKDDIQIEA